MREEFASRFTGAADFKLFTAPFDFPMDDAPAYGVGGATVQ